MPKVMSLTLVHKEARASSKEEEDDEEEEEGTSEESVGVGLVLGVAVVGNEEEEEKEEESRVLYCCCPRLAKLPAPLLPFAEPCRTDGCACCHCLSSRFLMGG